MQFQTDYKPPVSPSAPDFSGVVVGEEPVNYDVLKNAVRVDFDIDKTELLSIQKVARLSVEKEANRLIVNRENEQATLTPAERDAAIVCILAKSRNLYHNEDLPSWYKTILNSFAHKIHFV